MDEHDMGDIEMEHVSLSNDLDEIVDLYREGLDTMQKDVQEVIEGLFKVLKRQLDDSEVKSRSKLQSTQHRIKLLKTLHLNLMSMENAFSELKGRYSSMSGDDNTKDDLNNSFNSEHYE